ncbi:hypothetical protein AB0P15_36760 [Streptomyces sp. NPDC087917]|uniref:hypothetical protein n=1 Tax=Streptomyces sp. NPDC087917 TaxID=3155060 RepID=UPI00341D146C
MSIFGTAFGGRDNEDLEHPKEIAVPLAHLDRPDTLVTAHQVAETRWQPDSEQGRPPG